MALCDNPPRRGARGLHWTPLVLRILSGHEKLCTYIMLSRARRTQQASFRRTGPHFLSHVCIYWTIEVGSRPGPILSIHNFTRLIASIAGGTARPWRVPWITHGLRLVACQLVFCSTSSMLLLEKREGKERKGKEGGGLPPGPTCTRLASYDFQNLAVPAWC